MGAVSHTRRKRGTTARRWTDDEIRAAVNRATGGRKISFPAYRLLRRELDPDLFPSHNTVASRCPDLFS